MCIRDRIYAVILWAAIMLFPKAFAGIFSSDSELVGFAAKALRDVYKRQRLCLSV